MTNKNKKGGLGSFGDLILGLFSPKKRKERDDKVKNVLEEEAIESPWKSVARKFFRNRLGIVGVVGFVFVFAVVFIGSSLIKFDPYFSAGSMKNVAPGKGYTKIPDALLNEGVEDIQSGITFSAGLSKEGKIYVWGLDSADNVSIPENIKAELENKKVKQIAVGDRHILVLTEDDEILGWGNDAFNQTKAPADIKALIKREGVQKIAAGDQYSVVLTNEGTIQVWGSTLPNKLNMIPSKYDKQVKDFSVGSVNILLLLKDNSLVVVGSAGSEVSTSMPAELKDGKVKIAKIARATRSAAAIDEDGKLYVWGSSTERVNDAPKTDEKIVDISGGRSHMVALTESGKIYSWGAPEYDAIKSPAGEGYKKLYSGFYDNYAMKDEHTYSSWGLDGFLLGTDDMGRDIFTRLLHGGKATLQIAFVAVIIEIIIGVFVGMIAGFYGGHIDNLLMRFSEIIASFPFYPTIITLSATIPPDATQYQRILMVMILLGLLSWTGIARLVRGQILAERERDYITAARALGLREGGIMMSHILPNIVSIVIVQATIGYAGGLLSEAGLSFLGFGVVEPFPSWGNMMSSAQTIDVIEKFWWRWIFPGLSVFATALTVNLIGDALRDALDPKSLER